MNRNKQCSSGSSGLVIVDSCLLHCLRMFPVPSELRSVNSEQLPQGWTLHSSCSLETQMAHSETNCVTGGDLRHV